MNDRRAAGLEALRLTTLVRKLDAKGLFNVLGSGFDFVYDASLPSSAVCRKFRHTAFSAGSPVSGMFFRCSVPTAMPRLRR
jgi:hypothetical protein